jgi:hypothetical protein
MLRFVLYPYNPLIFFGGNNRVNNEITTNKGPTRIKGNIIKKQFQQRNKNIINKKAS